MKNSMGAMQAIHSDLDHSDLVNLTSVVMDTISMADEPNFRDDQYLRSYMSLYHALSSQNQVQNCNISFQDYKDGYCFWEFDLTPDKGADQSHLHPFKTGNLRPELQNARALDVTINVIVYAEFDSLIEIKGLREVTQITKKMHQGYYIDKYLIYQADVYSQTFLSHQ